jgi:hypothetical protein
MAAVLALALSLAAAEQSDRYAGRTLADALQLLQQRGLPIVYSSVIVTAGMRVDAEPRAADPRGVLDELLRPHGLEVRRGPGGLLQIVRVKRPPPKEPVLSKPIATPADASPPGTALAYDERVVVVGELAEERAGTGAPTLAVRGEELRLRASVLANDPLVALHAAPRVAATSDFRSDFSVRGNGPRHIAVVIDGIAASNLRHGVYGAEQSAALAMINPAVVERATLQVGAYPRQQSDAIGGQLGIRLREGSRTRTAFSGSVAGVSAAIVGEGPLGPSDGSGARGSWLVSLRQSFLDWPTTSFASEYTGIGFGFRDLQGKAVYDVTDTQRASVTVIAGQSVADHADEVGPGGFFQGRHAAMLINAGWRSAISRNVVLQQHVFVVSEAAENTDQSGATLSSASTRAFGYRADLTRVWRTMTLDAGADTSARASYVSGTWTVTPSFSLSPGIRVSVARAASGVRSSPWLNAAWNVRPAWTIGAAAGVGHQSSSHPLVVERARYLDLSLTHLLAPHLSVQATVFTRAERQIADFAFNQTIPSGTSRGIELALDAHGVRGWRGSMAYSYGRTRYLDPRTGEPFWGDFDQRHAMSAFASYEAGPTTVSTAFRTGSNFPVAGYFATRDGALFAGNRRNTVERPAYARLDVQVARGFQIAGRRVTLFGELLNVLNRTNVGPASGVIGPNGEAVGFSEKLLQRFATAGLRIDF